MDKSVDACARSPETGVKKERSELDTELPQKLDEDIPQYWNVAGLFKYEIGSFHSSPAHSCTMDAWPDHGLERTDSHLAMPFQGNWWSDLPPSPDCSEASFTSTDTEIMPAFPPSPVLSASIPVCSATQVPSYSEADIPAELRPVLARMLASSPTGSILFTKRRTDLITSNDSKPAITGIPQITEACQCESLFVLGSSTCCFCTFIGSGAKDTFWPNSE